MSAVDCCREQCFGERLFEDNGVWLHCQDAATIAGDEDVRDVPAPLNLIDGSNPTAFVMKPGIDNEQVRLIAFCGGNRLDRKSVV